MIEVKFFKEDTVLFAVIANKVVKKIVVDVKITTNPLCVDYILADDKNSKSITHRVKSSDVFEKSSELIDNIKNQVKAIEDGK